MLRAREGGAAQHPPWTHLADGGYRARIHLVQTPGESQPYGHLIGYCLQFTCDTASNIRTQEVPRELSEGLRIN